MPVSREAQDYWMRITNGTLTRKKTGGRVERNYKFEEEKIGYASPVLSFVVLVTE